MKEKLAVKDAIIIRLAQPFDLPKIFDLVDMYIAATKSNLESIVIDRDHTKNSLQELLSIQGIMMAEYNGQVIGGVAGLTVPNMFQKEIIFVVMFFYILPQYRSLTRQFMKELELLLTPTKCTQIVFGIPAHPNGKERERFMRLCGYTQLETHYAKRL